MVLKALCPAGKVAITGGHGSSDPTTNITQSRPILNNDGVATGWFVLAELPSFPAIHLEWSVTAYALCANAA